MITDLNLSLSLHETDYPNYLILSPKTKILKNLNQKSGNLKIVIPT